MLQSSGNNIGSQREREKRGTGQKNKQKRERERKTIIGSRNRNPRL